MMKIDWKISKIFLSEDFSATEIKGVVLFKVFADTKNMMAKTTPKTMQEIAKIVKLVLFLSKKLKYLTLAALIPSFNSPGAY